ncbi:MAG TPA: hypothetical protein VMN99_11810 [Anaerolineales bacterium]|nr:hypothetical protein [Anaerolineales bacterium]
MRRTLRNALVGWGLITILTIFEFLWMGFPGEWTLYGTVYLLVFLTPTFDYFPWSYGRLVGILILLVLLWVSRGRSGNTFFPLFNTWAESIFHIKVQPKVI